MCHISFELPHIAAAADGCRRLPASPQPRRARRTRGRSRAAKGAGAAAFVTSLHPERPTISLTAKRPPPAGPPAAAPPSSAHAVGAIVSAIQRGRRGRLTRRGRLAEGQTTRRPGPSVRRRASAATSRMRDPGATETAPAAPTSQEQLLNVSAPGRDRRRTRRAPLPPSPTRYGLASLRAPSGTRGRAARSGSAPGRQRRWHRREGGGGGAGEGRRGVERCER